MTARLYPFVLVRNLNIIKDKNGNKVDDDGVCPVCGESDGFLNIRKDHWAICQQHKVKWHIGRNWHAWCHEDEKVWQENTELLSGYQDVKPALREAAVTDRVHIVGGVCPRCGTTDGYLTIGKEHWGVCDRHKLFWHIGYNLFSCWRFEDENVWKENADILSKCREVRSDSAAFDDFSDNDVDLPPWEAP